jgi:hypothetical protein
MMPLKWQGSLFLRPQKVISKETTTGTVIVTGSAKPICCIRIRHANFPGTSDMQCVNARYTHCGAILFQINYARHIPALKIPCRWRHCLPSKYWGLMPGLNVPWSLRQYGSQKHWEKPTALKVTPEDEVIAWCCRSFRKGFGKEALLASI